MNSEVSRKTRLQSVQPAAESGPSFSSSMGVVVSLLGCVVGTGNIWRFPRIAAQNSAQQGSLVFLIVWSLFLFLWSAPMILIEYGVGRYCKSSPVKSFYKFLGEKAIWCGGWVTMVAFMISAYYAVVLGWCFFYVYKTIAVSDLPGTEELSLSIFNDFTERSYFPVLTHFLAIFMAGVCVIGGIRWIEKVNMVLVPALLLLVAFTFTWAMTREYTDYGIRFLFTPNWESIKDPKLWVDAASQNAFDTGAAMGLFIPYAAYFTRKTGVVRLATLVPAANNFVSIVCGITLFSTVFSTLVSTEPTLTETGILEIIKKSGPGSTGLTFVWIPILFSKLGLFGRILCVLFFVCLSFAGLSSLIANLQLTSQALSDFGLKHKFAAPVSMVLTFLVGLASALDINILTNQDFVWGFALMISGVLFQALVTIYGVMKFRRVIINNYSLSDWKLRFPWVIVVQVIAPLEALGLLIWWAVGLITSSESTVGKRWYDFGVQTFVTTIVEWVVLLLLLILVNVILIFKKPSWMRKERPKEISMGVTVSTINLDYTEEDDIGIEGIGHHNPVYASTDQVIIQRM